MFFHKPFSSTEDAMHAFTVWLIDWGYGCDSFSLTTLEHFPRLLRRSVEALGGRLCECEVYREDEPPVFSSADVILVNDSYQSDCFVRAAFCLGHGECLVGYGPHFTDFRRSYVAGSIFPITSTHAPPLVERRFNDLVVEGPNRLHRCDLDVGRIAYFVRLTDSIFGEPPHLEGKVADVLAHVQRRNLALASMT